MVEPGVAPVAEQEELAAEGLAYCRALRTAAATAGAENGVVDLDLEIAGVAIRVRFSAPTLAGMFSPALEHRRVQSAEPRFTLDVLGGPGDPDGLPQSPWGYAPIEEFEQAIARYEDERISIVLESRDRSVTAFDRTDGHAVVMIPDPDALPQAERDTRLRYPLQMILGFAGRPMIHSALVGEDGAGLIIPGASGSGKSTLAIAAAQAGMDFCSDDYVVLERDALIGHALLSTTKLTRDSAMRLGLTRGPGGAERAFGDRGTTTLKATIDVREFSGDRFRPDMEIAAIVVPRLGGAADGATRAASGTVALRALAPTTLRQQPSRDASLLGSMAAIARGRPTYELDLSTDPTLNVAALRRVLVEVRGGR